jgi:nucleoside phosphorylase
LHVTGIGKERARSSVKKLLDSRQWSDEDGLLLLGFAGGLDPALKSGDLVLSNRYYRAEGVSPFASEQQNFREPDRNLYQQALEAAREASLPLSQGSSLTVDQVIATPEAKKAAQGQYQAANVNMEDYWVAEAAAEAGVPFLSVRAVLDPAGQGLPVYLMGLSEHPARAVYRTLPRPWRVGTLLRLARQAKTAQGSLARFALAFIDHELSARVRDGQSAAR